MDSSQAAHKAAKPQNMTVSNFGAKFGTKGEVYRFLTVEAKVYLPDFRTVTIWHMKDLASGTKQVSNGVSSSPSVAHLLRGGQAHRRSLLREPQGRRHPRLRPCLPKGGRLSAQ